MVTLYAVVFQFKIKLSAEWITVFIYHVQNTSRVGTWAWISTLLFNKCYLDALSNIFLRLLAMLKTTTARVRHHVFTKILSCTTHFFSCTQKAISFYHSFPPSLSNPRNFLATPHFLTPLVLFAFPSPLIILYHLFSIPPARSYSLPVRVCNGIESVNAGLHIWNGRQELVYLRGISHWHVVCLC